MHWEAKYPEPKKPKPFNFWDGILCIIFAYGYMMAFSTWNILLLIGLEFAWGCFVYKRTQV